MRRLCHCNAQFHHAVLTAPKVFRVRTYYWLAHFQLSSFSIIFTYSWRRRRTSAVGALVAAYLRSLLHQAPLIRGEQVRGYDWQLAVACFLEGRSMLLVVRMVVFARAAGGLRGDAGPRGEVVR